MKFATCRVFPDTVRYRPRFLHLHNHLTCIVLWSCKYTGHHILLLHIQFQITGFNLLLPIYPQITYYTDVYVTVYDKTRHNCIAHVWRNARF